MAASLLPTRPVVIRACANQSDHNRRKPSSANWWTPLFGWSSDPDYIGSETKPEDVVDAKKSSRSESDLDPKAASRSRFARGCFTEEKAKQLRMLTTESFHDAMYHSAIASRLASDFKDRPDLE